MKEVIIVGVRWPRGFGEVNDLRGTTRTCRWIEELCRNLGDLYLEIVCFFISLFLNNFLQLCSWCALLSSMTATCATGVSRCLHLPQEFQAHKATSVLRDCITRLYVVECADNKKLSMEIQFINPWRSGFGVTPSSSGKTLQADPTLL